MAPTPRDRAFLDRLHEVVTRRQQQSGRGGRAAEQARWDIDGSVVLGRIDTAERRVYIGTRHIATPDDGVLVEDQHAPDVRRLWHHTSAMHPDEVLLKRRLQVDGWEIVAAETVFDFRTPAVVDASDVDREAAPAAQPGTGSTDSAGAPTAARPTGEEQMAEEQVVAEQVAGEPSADQPAGESATEPGGEAGGAAVPTAEVPGPAAAEDARVLAAGPRVAGLQETQAHVSALLRAATASVLAGEAVAEDAISALQQWNDDLAALALAVGLPATAGLAEVDATVQAAVARDQARRRAEIADAMALLDGLIDRFPFAAERLKDARDAMTAEYEEADAT